MTQQRQLPEARRQKLVVRELGDEVLIYDLEQHHAHCLNRTAGLVWKYADGEHTVAEIATRLESDFALAVSEDLVELSLIELGKNGLLQNSAGANAPKSVLRDKSQSATAMTRREMVKRVGTAVAIALPVVISITAPTPAQASTGRPSGSSCTSGPQCQSNLCVSNQCV